MKVPAIEPGGVAPRRHRFAAVGAHVGSAERAGGVPTRWIAQTVWIAALVALLAAGVAWALQQGRVSDAQDAAERSAAVLASARQQAYQATTEAQALNERLSAQILRAGAAERHATSLQGRVAHIEAVLDRTGSRLTASQSRVADLVATRDALALRLERAQEARRVAIAQATALIGPPLAEGRHVARFEAFGGGQSPPMAVLRLIDGQDWRVVAVAPWADIHVLEPSGLGHVTMAKFTDLFAKGAQRPHDLTQSDYRVLVRGDQIVAITELH